MDEVVTVDLEQGTEEWHKWRSEHLMASVAAIPMRCAPSYWQVRTPEHLRAYMDGWRPEISEETQRIFDHGHAEEDKVRDAYDLLHMTYMKPVCMARGQYGASLDGYNPARREWIEVKAPWSATSKTLKMLGTGEPPWDAWRERVPDHYWWQMAHQAHVIGDGADQCVYIVRFRGESWRIEIPIGELLNDWPELEQAWGLFLGNKPNIDEDSDVGRAVEYIAAQKEFEIAKDRFEKAKSAVLRDGPRVIDGYLKIIESSVKGRIDYKAMASNLIDHAEHEKWRGEPSKRTTIKITEET